MIDIFVRGHSPYIDFLEWRTAARWMACELMGRRAERLSLHLELSDYMRGRCGSVACSNWRHPRSFVIQIETGQAKRRKQLCTLAHELVHVKQIISGELSVLRGELRWKAKAAAGSDFADEPWEFEAWAQEAPLFKLYETFRKG